MSIEVTVEYAHREWNSYDHVVHIRNYQQLQAKVAELEAEVERLSAAHVKACQANADSQAELAAEQLNNKLLREALEAVIKVHGYESGIPVEAISTQTSTEALDKYVAEKVKEAGKFDMWKTNPYTKVLETSIEQLTKQRDLAVEALEKIAAPVRADGTYNRCREACEILARETLSAIKKSEGKR